VGLISWTGEGWVYLKRRQWDEALVRFKKALSINPDYEWAHQLRDAAQHRKDGGDRWKRVGGFLLGTMFNMWLGS
jgi:tetratricopeptide (TPR) repeat protein